MAKHYRITIDVAYKEDYRFVFPEEIEEHLRSNVQHCIEWDILLNDPGEVAVVEDWKCTVREVPTFPDWDKTRPAGGCADALGLKDLNETEEKK